MKPSTPTISTKHTTHNQKPQQLKGKRQNLLQLAVSRLTKISNPRLINLNQIGNTKKSLDLRNQSNRQLLTIKGLSDMITAQSEWSDEGPWVSGSVRSSAAAAGLVSIIIYGVCNNNFWHFVGNQENLGSEEEGGCMAQKEKVQLYIYIVESWVYLHALPSLIF